MKTSLLRNWMVILLLVGGYMQTAHSQNTDGFKIWGHVYDENNERIHQAVIMLMGTEPGYPVISREDGYFEIDAKSDSVLLRAEYLGYKTINIKVPLGCEVSIHMEPVPGHDPYLVIGDPPAIPRRLRTGYIFDDKGKSIFGAHILVQEEDINIDIETSSNKDGYFEIRSGDFGELTINVDGHKPIEFDLKTLKEEGGEESMLVKHDGLFIIIDFNW